MEDKKVFQDSIYFIRACRLNDISLDGQFLAIRQMISNLKFLYQDRKLTDEEKKLSASELDAVYKEAEEFSKSFEAIRGEWMKCIYDFIDTLKSINCEKPEDMEKVQAGFAEVKRVREKYESNYNEFLGKSNEHIRVLTNIIDKQDDDTEGGTEK